MNQVRERSLREKFAEFHSRPSHLAVAVTNECIVRHPRERKVLLVTRRCRDTNDGLIQKRATHWIGIVLARQREQKPGEKKSHGSSPNAIQCLASVGDTISLLQFRGCCYCCGFELQQSLMYSLRPSLYLPLCRALFPSLSPSLDPSRYTSVCHSLTHSLTQTVAHLHKAQVS